MVKVRVRVRVKELNPLQKPRVSPRFRMTQLEQGRQRPKIFLPLDQTRKKSLFLQPKFEAGVARIRFLVRQNMDFLLAPYVMRVRVWISHRRYHPCLLDCCQSKYGDLAFLLLFLFHYRCHPYLLNCCWSKIEDLSFLCTAFYSQLLIQTCLSPFMYIVLLLYPIKR